MTKVTVKRSEWLRGGRSTSRTEDCTGYLYTTQYNGLAEFDDNGDIVRNNTAPGRCCLGFWCNALGIADSDMKDCPSPAELFQKYANEQREHELPEAMVEELHTTAHQDGSKTAYNQAAINMLIQINDEMEMGEKERERKLITFGKEAGIDFTFVD